jgi:hypothetical protein
MIEYNAAKRSSGLRACADGLDANPDKEFAQKCMRDAADRIQELKQQHDKLIHAVENLIKAQGRYNTQIAYTRLADTLKLINNTQ